MTKLNKLIQVEHTQPANKSKVYDINVILNSKVKNYTIKKPIQEEDLKLAPIKSESHKSENHKVENHKVEDRKVENHKVEDRKVKDHKVEDRKVEDRKVENHKIEDRKVEDPKAENRKSEHHKPENHKSEQRKSEHHEKIKVVNPKAQDQQVENSVSEKPESQAIETIKDLKKLIIKVKFKVATTSLPEDIRELDSITKTQESGSNTKTPIDSSNIGQAHGVINSFNVSESSPYKKQAEGLFAQLQVGEDIGVFNGLLTAIKSARSDHNQFVEYAKLRRLVDKQQTLSNNIN